MFTLICYFDYQQAEYIVIIPELVKVYISYVCKTTLYFQVFFNVIHHPVKLLILYKVFPNHNVCFFLMTYIGQLFTSKSLAHILTVKKLFVLWTMHKHITSYSILHIFYLIKSGKFPYTVFIFKMLYFYQMY